MIIIIIQFKTNTFSAIYLINEGFLKFRWMRDSSNTNVLLINKQKNKKKTLIALNKLVFILR